MKSIPVVFLLFFAHPYVGAGQVRTRDPNLSPAFIARAREFLARFDAVHGSRAEVKTLQNETESWAIKVSPVPEQILAAQIVLYGLDAQAREINTHRDPTEQMSTILLTPIACEKAIMQILDNAYLPDHILGCAAKSGSPE